jgi:hypothetical protein
MMNLKMMSRVQEIQEAIMNRREQRKEDIASLKEELIQLEEMEEIVLEMLADIYEQQADAEDKLAKRESFLEELKKDKEAYREASKQRRREKQYKKYGNGFGIEFVNGEEDATGMSKEF